MERLANGTQVGSLPALGAAVGTPGYGTNGDPAAGLQASIFDADQYNLIQEEICRFIVDLGGVLNRGVPNQMIAALVSAFPGLQAPHRLIANPGYIKLPGGLILQWFRNLTTTTNAFGDASVGFVYPLVFPGNAVWGYSAGATDELTARNDVTCVVYQVTPGFMSMGLHAPGAGGGSSVACSGYVIGS